MIGTLTYTGSSGPGIVNTATVFTDVTVVNFNLGNQTLNVTYGTPSKIAHLDLSVPTTVTYTISGQNVTVTIS